MAARFTTTSTRRALLPPLPDDSSAGSAGDSLEWQLLFRFSTDMVVLANLQRYLFVNRFTVLGLCLLCDADAVVAAPGPPFPVFCLGLRVAITARFCGVVGTVRDGFPRVRCVLCYKLSYGSYCFVSLQIFLGWRAPTRLNRVG